MDHIIAALLSEFVEDLWHWFLDNANLIAIVGAYRAWSMHEHRKSVVLLKTAQARLAELQLENERIAAAIQENTDISTKAFHEANSVNVKIANLGLEHNALQRSEQNAGTGDQE